MWKLKVKLKLKLFIWKCMNSALPVNEKIYTRTRIGDLMCKSYGEDIEIMEHLFFHCRLAKEVWRLSPVKWDGLEEYIGNISRWWRVLIEARHRSAGIDHIALIVNILWQLWKARNDRVFNSVERYPLKTIQKAHEEWMNSMKLKRRKGG